MKIGLSLSLCVAEILDGAVPIEDIDVIYTNTAAASESQWDDLVSQYSRTYWHKSPTRAFKIVRLLRDAKRIVQLRLDNPAYQHSVANGIWMDVSLQANILDCGNSEYQHAREI